MIVNTTDLGTGTHERLLQALAEQLKTPVLHIARRAEFSADEVMRKQVLQSIEETASLALKLIDSYLLSTHLSQTVLPLEPVSLSAVLHDTLEQLQPIARQYDCELELVLAGKYGPVMAHREGLKAALLSLGHVFIEAGQQTMSRRRVVRLAVHKSRFGIVAGVFSDQNDLSTNVFSRAKALYGRVRQPLNSFTSSSGAGIFVADSLLEAMDAPLRVASHQKNTGLAATFMPSSQLSLV